MILESVDSNAPLGQGDILDDCPLLFWERSTGDAVSHESTKTVVRAIVLTQACDLAQSKATRVLVAVVHRAQDLAQRGALKGNAIRDQIRAHRVYGWYFMPASIGFDESVVDLRDLHTFPRSLLEQLIADGKLALRVVTPYREHLAQHFANTYSRIDLPSPYETIDESA